MRRCFPWVTAFLWLILSACSMEPIINHQVVDYFDANDIASNQVILRNILRARDGAPLHFSELANIRGVLSIQANASTTFPYGSRSHVTTIPQDLATFGLAVSSSPSFDVNSLDTKDFTDGVMKPILPKTAAFFMDEGTDYRLALMLLTSGVLTPGANEMILNAPNSSRVICYENAKPAFNQLPDKYDIFISGGPCPQDRSEDEYFAFLRVINNLDRVYPVVFKRRVGTPFPLDMKTDFREVAGIDGSKYTVQRLNNGMWELLSEAEDNPVVLCKESMDPHGKAAKPVGVLTNAPYDPVDIPADVCSPSIRNEVGTTGAGGAAKKSGTVATLSDCGASAAGDGHAVGGRPCGPYVFKLRSTLEVIQYVGQVLAFQARETQQHPDRPERCITLEWSQKPGGGTPGCDAGVLFHLEQAGQDFSSQRISVAYNGERWVLPAPRICTLADQAQCDHTLETISIISLLLNQNKSADDKYKTPAVQAVP
jgi:hypothetical protein